MESFPYEMLVVGWSASGHRTIESARRAARRRQNEAARHSGGPAPIAVIYSTVPPSRKVVEVLG